MKSFILIILWFFFGFNMFSQQQIPNGNFENWTGGQADEWNSLLLIYTAEQTTDNVQGDYAVKIVSQSLFGQFLPGLITLGVIDISNQTLTGGVKYTDRPDGISFFFKYLPSGIDTLFFGAFITKWNDVNLSADTIGVSGYLNSNTYDTYTEINIPFIYNSTEIPDTLNIIFSSSGFNGNAGSTLYIDSLSMINGTVISPTFCFPADEITSSQFKAHWMTVPNAQSYSIDVSENSDFSDFVTGYENLNTEIDTFYVVNVSAGTYYYRVRVNYDTGISINSNTVEVLIENTKIKNLISEDIKIIITGNYVNITSSGFDIKKIKAYNIEGKIIKEFSGAKNGLQFSLPKTGIYIIEIETGNEIIRRKINIIF